MLRVITGHDVAVAEWVGRMIGKPIVPPYTALGWIDDTGTLRIGFVFHSYIPQGNVNIDVASTAPWTRGVLRAVARYVFEYMPATRITAHTGFKNERVKSILLRAGFKAETGHMKDFYGENDGAVQFRLLKHECRWL